jgi:hypothetical protein
VAYTPVWEPLADALKRIMATGVCEEEAKADLCRAVADRKIDVRVRIATSDYDMPNQVFSDGNVGVPSHLRPEDLDWTHSRPFAKWPIGPKLGQHYAWITRWKDRPLDLIELSTVDVVEILCSGADGKKSSATARHENDAKKALASHLKNNPELRRSEAEAWCRTSGYDLTRRGFQNRVWPEARVQAGLEPKAPSGRKRNLPRSKL